MSLVKRNETHSAFPIKIGGSRIAPHSGNLLLATAPWVTAMDELKPEQLLLLEKGACATGETQRSY